MKYTYLLICLSALIHGQLNSKNGLEISPMDNYSLSIGSLNETSNELGITKENLYRTASNQLINNETPANENNMETFLLLNINCMAINYSDGRSTGMYTYSVQANFIRPVKFNYNENLLEHSAASVWNSYSSGFTNSSYIIIDDLIKIIDDFSIELKSANK